MTDLRIQISDALVAAHNGSIDQSGFRRDVDNIMAALSNHGKQQARIADLEERNGKLGEAVAYATQKFTHQEAQGRR